LNESNENVLSPEYESWKREREKIEARKNFKRYTKIKIDRILNEPDQYKKLMRKIEEIKHNRMLKIKQKLSINSETEKRIKERKRWLL
jgi:hypothetical protein